MKMLLLISSIMLFASYDLQESPTHFDNGLADLASKFRSVILNKDQCEYLKIAANDLAKDIDEAISEENKYTVSELTELKILKKEAEAMEEFIAAVGNCGDSYPSVDNFKLANERVGANVTVILKDKYCVDVISVRIGEYVTYLGLNNSSKSYTITYKWKSADGMTNGNGTMGLSKNHIRQIFNNRENISLKKISVSAITCQELTSWWD